MTDFTKLTEEQKQQVLKDLHIKFLNGEASQSEINSPEVAASYAIYKNDLAEAGLSEPTDFFASLQPRPPRPNDPYANATQSLSEQMGFTSTTTSPTGVNVPNPYAGTSLPETLTGIAETGFSLGSGAVAMGMAGLEFAKEGFSSLFTDKKFFEAMHDAAKDSERIMGEWVYTPKFESGKNMTAAVSLPFLKYDQMTTAAGELVKSQMGGAVKGGVDPAVSAEFTSLVDEIQEYRDREEVVPENLLRRAGELRQVVFDSPEVEINNPALFASISTKAFLDLLPDMLGGGRAVLKKRQLRNEYRDMAEKYGIDLKGLTEAQIDDLANSANLLTGGQSQIAQRSGNLQQRLRRREQVHRNVGNQLFENAKDAGEEAYFTGLQLQALDGSMANILQETVPDFANAKIATSRLKEFSEMLRDPDISTNRGSTLDVSLDATGRESAGFVGKPDASFAVNRLHKFRQKLNSDLRRLPKDRNYDQNVEFDSLIAMKDSIDNFMDDHLFVDLASGSSEAILKWKKANDWYTNHKKTFTDQSRGGNRTDFAGRAVEKITQQDLTPEQVKNIILGGTKLGLKDSSGLIVQRLNQIFGNDSPMMDALRQEVIFGIIPGLLEETPNVSKFVSDYNKFKMGNMTLIEELFQGDRLSDLNTLVDISKSMLEVAETQNRTITRRSPRLDRFIAANVAGHQLAQSSMKLSVVQSVIAPLLRGAKRYTIDGQTDTSKIMESFYGMKVDSIPFTEFKTFPYFSAISTTREAEEAEQGESLPRGEQMVEGAQRNIREGLMRGLLSNRRGSF
jgi:hypothetical protein